MALIEDLVSAAGVIGAAEKVVVPNLIQRGARRIRTDVTSHANAGGLSSVDHDRGIPTNPRAVLAFEFLVTGERRLVFGRDRVEVVGRGNHRYPEV